MQFHPQTDVRGSASDVLLTSSFDWTLKLWNFKRSRDRPLHTFSASADYIFDARWSPVHPSLLASGDGSGSVDLWDLCRDMEVPIHRVVDKTHSAVSSLDWHGSGSRLAAGFSDGRVSLLDVSPGAALPGPNAHAAFVELLAGLPAQDYGADAAGGAGAGGGAGDDFQP
jgi:dynein intermediate chain